MRTIIIEKAVYTYDELSETAKERVRETFSTWDWEDGTMQEDMQEIANYVLEQAGFSEAEALEYSLWTQGGEPRFSTESVSPVFLEPATPGKRRKRYSVRITNNYRGFDISVCRADGESILDDYEYNTAHDLARDLAWELSGTMLEKFYEADEFRHSEEATRETCEANGYEFDEHGNLS